MEKMSASVLGGSRRVRKSAFEFWEMQQKIHPLRFWSELFLRTTIGHPLAVRIAKEMFIHLLSGVVIDRHVFHPSSVVDDRGSSPRIDLESAVVIFPNLTLLENEFGEKLAAAVEERLLLTSAFYAEDTRRTVAPAQQNVRNDSEPADEEEKKMKGDEDDDLDFLDHDSCDDGFQRLTHRSRLKEIFHTLHVWWKHRHLIAETAKYKNLRTPSVAGCERTAGSEEVCFSILELCLRLPNFSQLSGEGRSSVSSPRSHFSAQSLDLGRILSSVPDLRGAIRDHPDLRQQLEDRLSLWKPGFLSDCLSVQAWTGDIISRFRLQPSFPEESEEPGGGGGGEEKEEENMEDLIPGEVVTPPTARKGETVSSCPLLFLCPPMIL